MDLKPEILDKCTLLQACEWIAFGWQPMLPIYEIDRKREELLYRGFDNPTFLEPLWENTKEQEKYSHAIYSAEKKLKLAIYQKQIIPFGITDIGLKTQNIGDEYIKNIDNIRFGQKNNVPDELYSSLLNVARVFPIDNIPANFITDLEKNELSTGETFNGIYHNIEISFAELQSVFPDKSKNPALERVKNEYTTPYLEIMHEVIMELVITKNNQLETKNITPIIAKKLQDRGIYTQRLASFMTTAIRLPESKKGGNKKSK